MAWVAVKPSSVMGCIEAELCHELGCSEAEKWGGMKCCEAEQCNEVR